MNFSYKPPLENTPIIYKDNSVLVVEKQAGLLSVPGRQEAHKDCLISRLKKIYETALIVHRLDMDTSGLMVLALNKSAHKHLSRQFEQRLVHKTYIADVWQVPEASSGQIDQPLRCDWPNRPLQIIDPELGKKAQTKWQILQKKNESARLALTPITGRSHQLRVHCQFIGHPILGDRFYAPKDALVGQDRLCLHASKLSFQHPDTQDRMTFHSEVPF